MKKVFLNKLSDFVKKEVHDVEQPPSVLVIGVETSSEGQPLGSTISCSGGLYPMLGLVEMASSKLNDLKKDIKSKIDAEEAGMSSVGSHDEKRHIEKDISEKEEFVDNAESKMSIILMFLLKLASLEGIPDEMRDRLKQSYSDIQNHHSNRDILKVARALEDAKELIEELIAASKTMSPELMKIIVETLRGTVKDPKPNDDKSSPLDSISDEF